MCSTLINYDTTVVALLSGEELLAVANQSASVTVLDAYPKTMDCKDDFGVGEIAIIQIEGKTELLLICDGTKFVLFSSTGSVKNFKCVVPALVNVLLK